MKKQILLKNINYFDIENDVIKENMDIIFENDLIKEIKKSTEENSSDFKIIDCTSKYAVPGLFESHAHLCWLTTFENNEKEKILKQFVKKELHKSGM